jgi:hypothetical protein
MIHDDHCQERNNNSITIIDEFHEQRQGSSDIMPKEKIEFYL